MDLGMVGLGRMGHNMAERLRAGGHRVVGYDLSPENRDVETLEALRDALPAPRAVWVMVPAGAPTQATVAQLAEVLEPGDLVIDGGNSRFTQDRPNAELLAEKGIDYVDVGVSGGVWGRAEGYELLTTQDELVPDVPAVFKAWQRGTVVRSWLLELMVRALEEDPELDAIEGYAEDSGEGRWTVEECIRNAVPLHTIAASLFARFESRQEESQAMKAIAALRQQFGGHAVKPAD